MEEAEALSSLLQLQLAEQDAGINATLNATNCTSSRRPVFPPAGDVAVTVMYSSVFVVALVGNGLVMYCVVSSPRMRTATNYMLLNLAVGDMLMTLLCVPFTFVSTLLLQFWPFGAELCHTVSFSQAVSVLVSAYTLVVISVDRYLAVMRPLRPRLSRRDAKWSMAAVWAGALATALPIPYWSRLGQPEPWHRACDRWVCQEDWPTAESRQYYSMALMSLQYLAPSCVLLFTYTRIAVVIWNYQMIKMMVVVVAGYTICWLPFNALVVAWDTDTGLGEWKGLPPLWFCTHWLAMSHSCLNPLIYYWMNARFRACYRLALAPLARLPCVGGCVRRCLPWAGAGAAAASFAAGADPHAQPTHSTWTTVQLASYPHPHPARARCIARHGQEEEEEAVGMLVVGDMV
ncbi:RYamide receptor [Frankliniella fusca]|uniref:RYamide receptor n=1 Tax=Frankliniella fusca TaxID=407009 RepID=A0AAE1LH26_9NEOP|nr:RYamide receptor [Frankliniella fusca]